MKRLLLLSFLLIEVRSSAQIDSAKIYFMPLKMESRVRIPYDQVATQVEPYTTSDSSLCVQLFSFLRDSLSCTYIKKGVWSDFRALIEGYSSGAKVTYYISYSGREIIKPDGRTYSVGDITKYGFLSRFLLGHFTPVTPRQKINYKILHAEGTQSGSNKSSM